MFKLSIKGSCEKIKIETVFPIFLIFTVLSAAIRTYQCLSIIEPDTGFYSKSNFTIAFLYIALAVAGVGIFLVSYVAKKVPISTLPQGKNIPLAIASVVFGVTFFADALVQAATCISFSDVIAENMSVVPGGMASYLIKSGIAPKGLEALFAVLSAIYFINFAAKYFGASATVENRKILAVMPVFWATMRMIQRFTRTISIIFVSDLLLELFMIAFMMMFFLSFAQLASNVNSRHVVNKVYAYGLIGAMIAVTVSVARIVVLAVDSSLAVVNDPLEICDLGFAVFAAVFCFVMLKMPREDNITLRQVEKLRKEHDEETQEN